jgi:hypothetical protein
MNICYINSHEEFYVNERWRRSVYLSLLKAKYVLLHVTKALGGEEI